MRYVYLGDRLTDSKLVNQPCDPVLRADGRVVVGTGRRVPRNQLVRFADGTEVVVLGRRLRLTKGELCTTSPEDRPGDGSDQRDMAGPRAAHLDRTAAVDSLTSGAASDRISPRAPRAAPSTPAERETPTRA